MASPSNTPSIMVIAGDPSGDVHAAAVLQRLRESLPHCATFGIGGPRMEQAGFVPLMPFGPFNRMGLWEVLSHIGFFLRAKRNLVRELEQRRPHALLCVDYPGFNIVMMKEARKRAIPVIWYIAPKVWAWKKKRAHILGENADHIAAIFPFETAIFSPFKAGISYVGNPLVEAIDGRRKLLQPLLEESRAARETEPSHSWRLALIPGSREQEVAALLPTLVETVALLRSRNPRLSVTVRVSQRTDLPEELYRVCGAEIGRHTGSLDELLAWCDSALITSGTATLEAALLGKPFILVYRTSRLSYAAFRLVSRIRFIGLPNILAEKQIIRECLQGECRPDILAEETMALVQSPERYRQVVEELGVVTALLGPQHPSRTVSAIIEPLIRG